MSPRAVGFLAVGAVSGLLSAAIIVFYHMGDVAAPEVAGYCFGLRMSSHCEGVDGAVYVFPGLIFGVLFAALQVWRGRDHPTRVLSFFRGPGLAHAAVGFFFVLPAHPLVGGLPIPALYLPLA